jgi:glycosyltransferase involved in cell wall biosynthesis
VKGAGETGWVPGDATASERETRPLVWVVTPVYNGEKFLAECIESVLAQTYGDWLYHVVDNRSTDRTADIARRYAEADSRIVLSQNEEFLPILANWNRALRALPDQAKYCKVVHADDTLAPECLEKMVAVAERYPSASVVSSYADWGGEVRHTEGVAYPLEVVSGREICRATLEGRSYVFGSPSSLLMRADLIRERIRERGTFYNEHQFHADTEVCFELLRTSDLGFVHQVLTHTRIHDAAASSLAMRVNTYPASWLTILAKYGRDYLDPRSYRRRLSLVIVRYFWFIAKAVLRGKLRDPQFREHHRRTTLLALRSIPRVVYTPRSG